METQLNQLEQLFLGLGDKTRLRLLRLMANGPVSVGFLTAQLGESQPKISRHLAYLRGAGLVEASRDGKWIYYGIAALREPACESIMRNVLEQLGRSSARLPQNIDERERNVRSGVEPGIERPTDEAYDDYEDASVLRERDHASEELEIFLL